MAGTNAKTKNHKPANIIPVPDENGGNPATGEAAIASAIEDQIAASASQPFVGRWNTLVSNTNWEKGRIIEQWRDALIAADAPAKDYSDEAWSRLVGGVTGQHAGRLRRVYQRFGRVHEQYAGLFWSHFQAALDWDDAEMWLEGAVQSQWSVSQMRHQRWETLGAVASQKPRPDDIISSELDEDFEPAQGAVPSTLSATYDEVHDTPRRDAPDFGDDGGDAESGKQRRSREEHEEHEDEVAASGRSKSSPTVRPFENLPDLPDDLADAFESFKLAILRHKAAEWAEVACDDVLTSLDALKQLAITAA
jgi:hypothetical protein